MGAVAAAWKAIGFLSPTPYSVFTMITMVPLLAPHRGRCLQQSGINICVRLGPAFRAHAVSHRVRKCPLDAGRCVQLLVSVEPGSKHRNWPHFHVGDDSCHVCIGDYTRLHNEPLILIGSYVYLVVVVVFLINLPVAQCSCADEAIYADRWVSHASSASGSSWWLLWSSTT